jgi:hypothetical protein
VCLDLLTRDVLAKEDAVYAVSLCTRVARLISKREGELLISSLEVVAVNSVVIVKLSVRLRDKGLKLCIG